MDQAIINHLDAWIIREFDGLDLDDDIFPDRDAMIELAASDEAWLDRGWWRVYDAVKASNA